MRLLCSSTILLWRHFAMTFYISASLTFLRFYALLYGVWCIVLVDIWGSGSTVVWHVVSSAPWQALITAVSPSSVHAAGTWMKTNFAHTSHQNVSFLFVCFLMSFLGTITRATLWSHDFIFESTLPLRICGAVEKAIHQRRSRQTSMGLTITLMPRFNYISSWAGRPNVHICNSHLKVSRQKYFSCFYFSPTHGQYKPISPILLVSFTCKSPHG